MRKKNSRAVRCAMAAVGILAIAAAFTSTANAAGDRMKLTLTFPTDVTTFELPYFVAEDQGWYDEHGLDVEEIWVVGDANALRTVLSGDADVTVIGLPTAFDAIVSGAEIVAIGSWQPVVDYQIVGKKGVVASLSDLPGKTLSSAEEGGLTTELPKMVLQKHGMDPSSVKFLKVGGHADRLKAVVAGRTQAAMINTLTATTGKLSDEINIITALAKEFPGLAYVQLVVQKKDLADAEKRKALEVFLEGSVHGARFIMENPEEAAAILHKRNPDLDLDLIKSVITELNSIGVWGVNGGADREVVEYTAGLANKLGMVGRDISADEVLDSSIAEAVLAKTGKY